VPEWHLVSLDKAIAAFIEVGKDLGVLKKAA